MCNKDLVSLEKPSQFIPFLSRLAKSSINMQLLNEYKNMILSKEINLFRNTDFVLSKEIYYNLNQKIIFSFSGLADSF
jgi:hypothetical protein